MDTNGLFVDPPDTITTGNNRNYVTRQQRYETEVEPTQSETYRAAQESENTLIALDKIGQGRSFERDFNYQLPPEDSDEFKTLTDGIRPEFFAELGEARSKAHANWIADQIREDQRNLDTMARDGLSGTLTHLGVAVADPTAYLAAIATSGAAATWKMNRLRKILTVGGLTAAESAAIEAIIAEGSPTRDSGDVAMAGGLGFLLGGALGSFGRTADQAKTVEQLQGNLDRAYVMDKAEGFGGDSAGAGRVDGMTVETDRTQPFDPDMDIDDLQYMADGGIDKARIDLAGSLLKSKSNTVRWIGDRMVGDTVGRADGSVARADTVSEASTLLFKQTQAKLYRETNPALKSWMGEQGYSLWNPVKARQGREEFFSLVGRAMRGEDIANPHVQKAAKAQQAIYKQFLDEAQGRGTINNRGPVKGFDTVDENANYVPRVYSGDAMRRLVDEEGIDAVIELVRRAMLPKLEGVTKKMSQRIAKAHVNKVMRLDTESMLGRSKPLNNMELDDIEDLLRTDPDIKPEEVDNIIGRLRQTRENQQSSPTARGKPRRALDETAAIKTRSGKTVRFSDILENNSETLFLNYAREMSGHIAFMRSMGVKSDADWDKLLKRVTEELPLDEAKKTVTALNNTRRSILGKSVEANPGGAANRTGRILMDWNFLRLMGQMGFAQLAETGNILKYGPKESLQQLSFMKDLRRDALTGKLDDSLSQELEEVLAIGAEMLTNTMHGRSIEFGTDVAGSTGIMGRIESAQDTAKYYFQGASLMGPVNVKLQRMAGRVIAQKFANAAFDSSKAVTKQRLASIGLNEDVTDRIYKQIRQYASTEQGGMGGKLRRLNLEKWDDVEAREKLIFGMSREARRLIQENDIGSIPAWMQHLGWKMVFQFRSFIMGAWAQQTLHNLRMKDAQTLTTILFNSMAAATAYTAQTYLNAQGRDDKEEYLSERLSWDSLAKAGFSRAGYASLLPSIWDTAMSPFADPTFNYRSSNLAQNLITGNPTASLLMDAGRAFTSAGAGVRGGYDYSQEDFRALSSAIWFQNMTGARNAMDMLEQTLPRYSQ